MLAIVLELLQMLIATRCWRALASLVVGTTVFLVGEMAGLTSGNNVANLVGLIAISCGTCVVWLTLLPRLSFRQDSGRKYLKYLLRAGP